MIHLFKIPNSDRTSQDEFCAGSEEGDHPEEGEELEGEEAQSLVRVEELSVGRQIGRWVQSAS